MLCRAESQVAATRAAQELLGIGFAVVMRPPAIIWRAGVLCLVAISVISVLVAAPVELWLNQARALVSEYPVLAPASFIVVFAIGSALMVPGSILIMSGGFLFGWLPAIGWVTIGAAFGSSLAAALSRTLLRKWLEQRFANNRVFLSLDRALRQRDLEIVVLTRLSLLIPYNLLNLMYGLTSIRLRRLALGTMVGMLPAVALYAYLGSLLTNAGDVLAGQAETGWAGTVLLGVGLVSIALVTWLIHRAATQALKRELLLDDGEAQDALS